MSSKYWLIYFTSFAIINLFEIVHSLNNIQNIHHNQHIRGTKTRDPVSRSDSPRIEDSRSPGQETKANKVDDQDLLTGGDSSSRDPDVKPANFQNRYSQFKAPQINHRIPDVQKPRTDDRNPREPDVKAPIDQTRDSLTSGPHLNPAIPDGQVDERDPSVRRIQEQKAAPKPTAHLLAKPIRSNRITSTKQQKINRRERKKRQNPPKINFFLSHAGTIVDPGNDAFVNKGASIEASCGPKLASRKPGTYANLYLDDVHVGDANGTSHVYDVRKIIHPSIDGQIVTCIVNTSTWQTQEKITIRIKNETTTVTTTSVTTTTDASATTTATGEKPTVQISINFKNVTGTGVLVKGTWHEIHCGATGGPGTNAAVTMKQNNNTYQLVNVTKTANDSFRLSLTQRELEWVKCVASNAFGNASQLVFISYVDMAAAARKIWRILEVPILNQPSPNSSPDDASFSFRPPNPLTLIDYADLFCKTLKNHIQELHARGASVRRTIGSPIVHLLTDTDVEDRVAAYYKEWDKASSKVGVVNTTLTGQQNNILNKAKKCKWSTRDKNLMAVVFETIDAAELAANTKFLNITPFSAEATMEADKLRVNQGTKIKRYNNVREATKLSASIASLIRKTGATEIRASAGNNVDNELKDLSKQITGLGNLNGPAQANTTFMNTTGVGRFDIDHAVITSLLSAFTAYTSNVSFSVLLKYPLKTDGTLISLGRLKRALVRMSNPIQNTIDKLEGVLKKVTPLSTYFGKCTHLVNLMRRIRRRGTALSVCQRMTDDYEKILVGLGKSLHATKNISVETMLTSIVVTHNKSHFGPIKMYSNHIRCDPQSFMNTLFATECPRLQQLAYTVNVHIDDIFKNISLVGKLLPALLRTEPDFTQSAVEQIVRDADRITKLAKEFNETDLLTHANTSGNATGSFMDSIRKLINGSGSNTDDATVLHFVVQIFRLSFNISETPEPSNLGKKVIALFGNIIAPSEIGVILGKPSDPSIVKNVHPNKLGKLAKFLDRVRRSLTMTIIHTTDTLTTSTRLTATTTDSIPSSETVTPVVPPVGSGSPESTITGPDLTKSSRSSAKFDTMSPGFVTTPLPIESPSNSIKSTVFSRRGSNIATTSNPQQSKSSMTTGIITSSETNGQPTSVPGMNPPAIAIFGDTSTMEPPTSATNGQPTSVPGTNPPAIAIFGDTSTMEPPTSATNGQPTSVPGTNPPAIAIVGDTSTMEPPTSATNGQPTSVPGTNPPAIAIFGDTSTMEPPTSATNGQPTSVPGTNPPAIAIVGDTSTMEPPTSATNGQSTSVPGTNPPAIAIVGDTSTMEPPTSATNGQPTSVPGTNPPAIAIVGDTSTMEPPTSATNGQPTSIPGTNPPAIAIVGDTSTMEPPTSATNGQSTSVPGTNPPAIAIVGDTSTMEPPTSATNGQPTSVPGTNPPAIAIVGDTSTMEPPTSATNGQPTSVPGTNPPAIAIVVDTSTMEPPTSATNGQPTSVPGTNPPAIAIVGDTSTMEPPTSATNGQPTSVPGTNPPAIAIVVDTSTMEPPTSATNGQPTSAPGTNPPAIAIVGDTSTMEPPTSATNGQPTSVPGTNPPAIAIVGDTSTMEPPTSATNGQPTSVPGTNPPAIAIVGDTSTMEPPTSATNRQPTSVPGTNPPAIAIVGDTSTMGQPTSATNGQPTSVLGTNPPAIAIVGDTSTMEPPTSATSGQPTSVSVTNPPAIAIIGDTSTMGPPTSATNGRSTSDTNGQPTSAAVTNDPATSVETTTSRQPTSVSAINGLATAIIVETTTSEQPIATNRQPTSVSATNDPATSVETTTSRKPTSVSVTNRPATSSEPTTTSGPPTPTSAMAVPDTSRETTASKLPISTTGPADSDSTTTTSRTSTIPPDTSTSPSTTTAELSTTVSESESSSTLQESSTTSDMNTTTEPPTTSNKASTISTPPTPSNCTADTHYLKNLESFNKNAKTLLECNTVSDIIKLLEVNNQTHNALNDTHRQLMNAVGTGQNIVQWYESFMETIGNQLNSTLTDMNCSIEIGAAIKLIKNLGALFKIIDIGKVNGRNITENQAKTIASTAVITSLNRRYQSMMYAIVALDTAVRSLPLFKAIQKLTINPTIRQFEKTARFTNKTIEKLADQVAKEADAAVQVLDMFTCGSSECSQHPGTTHDISVITTEVTKKLGCYFGETTLIWKVINEVAKSTKVKQAIKTRWEKCSLSDDQIVQNIVHNVLHNKSCSNNLDNMVSAMNKQLKQQNLITMPEDLIELLDNLEKATTDYINSKETVKNQKDLGKQIAEDSKNLVAAKAILEAVLATTEPGIGQPNRYKRQTGDPLIDLLFGFGDRLMDIRETTRPSSKHNKYLGSLLGGVGDGARFITDLEDVIGKLEGAAGSDRIRKRQSAGARGKQGPNNDAPTFTKSKELARQLQKILNRLQAQGAKVKDDHDDDRHIGIIIAIIITLFSLIILAIILILYWRRNRNKKTKPTQKTKKIRTKPTVVPITEVAVPTERTPSTDVIWLPDAPTLSSQIDTGSSQQATDTCSSQVATDTCTTQAATDTCSSQLATDTESTVHETESTPPSEETRGEAIAGAYGTRYGAKDVRQAVSLIGDVNYAESEPLTEVTQRSILDPTYLQPPTPSDEQNVQVIHTNITPTKSTENQNKEKEQMIIIALNKAQIDATKVQTITVEQDKVKNRPDLVNKSKSDDASPKQVMMI